MLRDGASVDERRDRRSASARIRFDADRGFLLNDKPVKLKGVCIHQDHAGVGVAVPDALLRLAAAAAEGDGLQRDPLFAQRAGRRAARRCATGMGFLVMDENRQFNPAPDYMAQLEWLVRRDRNHPSVILWSVFNEEPMQGTEAGYEMVRRMAPRCKRSTTAARSPPR